MNNQHLVKRGTVSNSLVVKMESSKKHTKKASYEEEKEQISFSLSRDKETEKSIFLALLSRILYLVIMILKMVFGT